jgi:hypothetical protein
MYRTNPQTGTTNAAVRSPSLIKSCIAQNFGHHATAERKISNKLFGHDFDTGNATLVLCRVHKTNRRHGSHFD